MNTQSFQQGMTYLASAYGIELCRERAAVYWDQLGQLDDTLFLAAVKAHVSHQPRFPSVAELREAYRQQCLPQWRVYRLPRPRHVDREQARRVLDDLHARVRS
jgi:hypothetical protein